MSLADIALLVGIVAGLFAVGAGVWTVARRTWSKVQPRWKAYLLRKGRVECPKCGKVYTPFYTNDPYFGQSSTECPRCKTRTAEGYYHEPPPEDESRFS